MAKRKKLNKRVILLIAVFTLIVVGCIGTYLWLLPNDPMIFINQANAALARSPKDYDRAVKAYEKAIKIGEDLQQAEHQYLLAELYFERAKEIGVSQEDKNSYVGKGFGYLQRILQHHPSFIKAHRLYEKNFWEYNIYFTPRGYSRKIFSRNLKHLQSYISSVDKILKIEDDAKLYFRRGLAKKQLATSNPATYNEPTIADFRKAIALQPTETQYWGTLARFYLYLKQDKEKEGDKEAKKVYQEGIEANPKKAIFLTQYAEYLIQKTSWLDKKKREKREEEALKILQDAITVEPENSQVYLSLSALYLRKKQLKEASQALAQAQKLDDSQIRLYLILSDIRRAEKDLPGAAQALREALKMLDNVSGDKTKLIDPFARARINFWLAEVLLDINDTSKDKALKDKALAEARQCYDSLQKLAPNTVYQYQIGGKLAYVDKDWNKAREYLQKTSNVGLGGNTMFKLIQVYLHLRMPGSAENFISNVLKRKNLTEEGRVVLLSQLAFFLAERREYEGARRYGEKVLKAQPDNEKIKELMQILDVAEGKIKELPKDSQMGRKMMLRRAQELIQQEKYDSAIPLLEKLCAKEPRNYKILAILVMAMERVDRRDQALKLVRDTLKTSPDQKGLKQWLLLLEEPDTEKRLQLELQFADQETDPLAKVLRKMVIVRRYSRFDEVLKYLNEAEKIDPDNLAVIDGLFQRAMLDKDWKKAITLAERAGKINETAGVRLKAQALIREQNAIKDITSRDYTPAITLLEELLKSKPYLSMARLLLANCYIKANQPEKAKTQFEICIAQNRQDITAMVALARLAASQQNLDEHNKWVRLAYRYPAGKANRYIREQYLRQEVESKDIKNAIQQREKTFKQEKWNLDNVFRLAKLYEKTKQIGKAQEMYEYIFKSISDKVQGAAVLADFYRRNKLSSKADVLFGDMLKNAKDSQTKAATYIAYGNFLRSFDFDSARAMYKKAIQVDENSIKGNKALANLLATEAQTLTQQGNIAQSKAKWNESITILKKLVDQNPDDLSVKKTLYRHYINAGMVPEASMGFQKLIEKYPDDPQALVGLGLARMKQNDLVAAEKLFKQAIKLQPGAVDAHIFLSEIHQAHGDLLAAVKEIKFAIQQSRDLALRMDLAKLYQAMDQHEDAARIYNDIIKDNDLYLPAYKGLIYISDLQEKWATLESLVAIAQEKFPDSPEFYRALAKMWKKRGNPDRQIQALESALKLNPDNETMVREYFYALVQAEMDEKLMSESKKYLNRSAHKGVITAILARSNAKRQPNSEQAFNQFLEALGQLQQPDDVFFVTKLMQDAYDLEKLAAKSSEITKALPNEWRVLLVLGDINGKLGKFPQAEKLYNRALLLCSNANEKTWIFQKLALLYTKANNLEKTEATYKQIIQLNPNSVAALNNLAYLYVGTMNKPQDALPLIQKALQVQPGSINLIDTYAWTLAKLGKFQQAREELNKLIRKNISNADIFYHMGYIMEKTTDPEGARNYYRKALEALGGQKDKPIQATIQAALDRVENALNEKE